MVLTLSTWLIALAAMGQSWKASLVKVLPTLCENQAIMGALGASPAGVSPRLTFVSADLRELETDKPLEMACYNDYIWLTDLGEVFFRSMDQAVWKIEAVNEDNTRLELRIPPYLMTAQNSTDPLIRNAGAGMEVVIVFLGSEAGYHRYHHYEVLTQ